MTNKKVAIIGGGITGLVAGYRLLQKGCQVTIFEREKKLGGLLGGFKMEGQNLEKAYHHIFKTDKYIVNLIEELGLLKKLKWCPESIAMWDGKTMQAFTTPLDLLELRHIGLIGKIRTGLIGLWLRWDKKWQKYESVTATEWVKKWGGKEAYGVIWEPLLRGKFHHFANQISMVWLWARIHSRGGGGLGYLEGGFGQIINGLATRIKKMGGEIKFSSNLPPRELGTSLDKGRLKSFDRVISSAPLSDVDYLGAVTVVFSSSQNLSKFYWHNINDIESPFVALVQHTNLVDKKYYKNKNIYYLGTYLPQNHKYFKANDKIIFKDFFTYLKKIFPSFDEKQISEKKIFKFKYAQHIVGTNYQLRITNYELNKKIINVNFANIYPEDRGVNFAVREGEKG